MKRQVERVDAVQVVLEELPWPRAATTMDGNLPFYELHSDSHFFVVAAHEGGIT